MIKSSTILVFASNLVLLSCDGAKHRPKGFVDPKDDASDRQGQVEVDAAAQSMDASKLTNGPDGGSGDAGPSTTARTSDGAQVIEAAAPMPLPDAGAPLCLLRTTQWSDPYVIEEAEGLRADIVHDVSSDGLVWVYSVRLSDAGVPGADADLSEPATGDAGTDDELDAARMIGDSSADDADPVSSAPVVDDGPLYEHFIVRLPAQPVPLVLPEGVDLRHGATLNTAADALIVTLDDQGAFAVVQQNEQGEWYAESSGFTALLSAARHSGTRYSHPSLSKDGSDNLLYFSARNGGNPVLTTAFWNDLYWEIVASDSSLFMLLEPDAEHRVSSVSTDNRTVFTWDAKRVAATAVELSLDIAQPVQIAQNIESVSPVFVNADCQRLFTLDEESRFVELRSEPLVPADQLDN